VNEVSLSRVIAYWADRDPDAPAISHDDVTVTRAELERRTNRLARAFEQLGVGQDDFVTVALPNCLAFLESIIAIWKLGATPLPVSYRLPELERRQIIEIGKPTLVIGADPGSHGDTVCVPAGFEPDAALSDAPLPERTARHWKVLTSGGSTGRPKLIVSEEPATADLDEEKLGFVPNLTNLVPGPLYHNGPFIFALLGLRKGHHVIITSRFDAAETLRLIDEYAVEMMYLVPTMMQRMLALPEQERARHDVSSLKVVWHMAAPCPPWVKEAMIDWFGAEVLFELYGGTEAQGYTVITGTEWLTRKGSVGKPIDGCEMKVVDDDGKELPRGEIGEIYMLPEGGQGSTYHYVGAEVRDMAGGWESLGDMGYMDEEGYLFLTDRRTDMILSGGANIYPAEVEAAIDSCPGVRSSAVIGLPDRDMGNLVHAVVDAPAGDVTEERLLAHLADSLVRYKIPRTIEFVTEPVRDDAGKTRRTALRAARMQA